MRSEIAAPIPNRRPRRPGSFVGVTFLVAALALALSMVPTVSAASYPGYTATSWSNGVVLCEFSPASPLVAVSAFGVGESGLNASAMTMNEVEPNGSLAATADLAGATWTVANESDEDSYDLAYSALVTLETGASASTARGPYAAVGTADVTVQFVLPAYAGSPDGPTNVVNVVVQVSHWTWQNSEDHLELSLGVALSYPGSGSLNATSAPGWLLQSGSSGTASPVEQFGANASATATTGAGANVTISATPSVAQSNSTGAVVSVAFGTAAGAFSSLSFTARVGVVLPATVAGIPVADLAAAAVAGVLVSAVVALGVRRVRRKPSTLIYVTEEEGR